MAARRKSPGFVGEPVTVAILTEKDVGPVNVGRYQAAPADLADGDRSPLLLDVKGRLYVVVPSAVAPPAEVKKNRDFEKGTIVDWTHYNAVISQTDPHGGEYCCELQGTGSWITQPLENLAPVNTVWQFQCYAKPETAGNSVKLIMHHTDGTERYELFTLSAGWQLVSFSRREMDPGKILSDIKIESYSGKIWVDDVSVGLATEIVSGTVEATQVYGSNLQAEVTPRPKGGVLEKGSVTTTASYATVASRTVTNGKTFQLAKILVSCDKDVMYKLRWNATDISAEVYVSGKVPFTDWFPWNYKTMIGDGSKAFDIQAKYPSGGSAGTCYAEIVGEEV